MEAGNDMLQMLNECLWCCWRDNNDSVRELKNDGVANVGGEDPVTTEALAVEPTREGEEAAITEDPYGTLADAGVCPHSGEPG